MAQRFYGIDLQDNRFSMLSEQQTRTLIGSTAGEAPAADSKPGIAYCHNVMPSKEGIDSVGYLSVIPAVALPAGLTLDDVRIVYGDLGSRLHMAWDSNGNVYALTNGATAWLALPATVPATVSASFDVNSVTIGRVNGISYIFYSGIGGFTFNETTNILDPVVFVGLAIADIIGMTSSSGYLIAYTAKAIAWSSTIDPKDFVPSQVTGAGGGNVAGIAGDILFILPNTLGLLIYTKANVLAGTYTGNATFPFKIREIENSHGGVSLDLTAHEANAFEQFAFTKSGLQAINSKSADTILPEVTDFLAGKRFEDFNETTLVYELTNLGASTTMKKKVKYISSRYLVISYGITSFTHALILDTALNKMGKLRITHTDMFEYIGNQTELAKESLAVLLPTGEVKVVDFSSTRESSGVVVLGKLQFVRSHWIDLLGIEVENVVQGRTLSLYSQVSLDGKTFTTVQGAVNASAANISEYNFRASGKNHSLVFIGDFNLVTVQVRYITTGRR